MAACPKCGKGNIKRRKGRPKKCKRCGYISSIELKDYLTSNGE